MSNQDEEEYIDAEYEYEDEPESGLSVTDTMFGDVPELAVAPSGPYVTLMGTGMNPKFVPMTNESPTVVSFLAQTGVRFDAQTVITVNDAPATPAQTLNNGDRVFVVANMKAG